MEAFVQDLRFAGRVLARNRSFTLTAGLVLALGIGVNNMLFTILYAHTMRGLPIEDADRVLYVSSRDETSPDRGMSYPDFEDLRSGATLTKLAAFSPGSLVIGDERLAPERIQGLYVTAEAFDLVSPPPVLGRVFTAAEAGAAAPQVVVLSTAAWRERFAGDPGILGRSILINGQPASVVGVLTDRSGFPVDAEAWVPLLQMPGLARDQRGERSLRGLARVRDGHTVPEARAELEAITDRLAAAHPETNRGVRTRVLPINERYLGSPRQPAWQAFMAVGFLVLFISCANVATLLLGRASGRAREVAVRTSLGATRGRIVRQLLLESAVLAAIGGVLGLATAALGLQVFRGGIPAGTLPYWLDYAVDGGVIAALVGVSVATVFLFGLVPAIHAARTDVSATLADSGQRLTDRSSHRWWSTGFLAGEVALAVLLMLQMALGVRIARAGVPSDEAVTSDGVLTASVTLAGPRYESVEQRRSFHAELLQMARTIPGVTSASLATALPRQGGPEHRLHHAGETRVREDVARVVTVGVAPTYFDTLGLTMLRGREISETDTDPGQAVAVVNERLARLVFERVDVLGERIAVSLPTGEDTPVWRTIVGVAPDVRQGATVGPVVYVPSREDPPPSLSLLVRTAGDASALAPALRAGAFRLDPTLPLDRVLTMQQVVERSEWVGRLSNRLIVALTTLAVVLSGIGLLAVTLHRTGQRLREIGVRVALGAGTLRVARLVMVAAAAPVGLGLACGALLALAWSRAFQAGGPPAPGAEPIAWLDPLVLLIVAGVLAIMTVGASLVPLRRVLRMDLGGVLRCQ